MSSAVLVFSTPLISRQPFTIPSNFVATTAPSGEPISDTTCWFVCQGSYLLVMSAESTAQLASSPLLPPTSVVQSLGIELDQSQFLGYLDGVSCVAVRLPKETTVPQGLELCNLRSLYGELQEEWFAIAARAVQIMEWDRTHRYCGSCATPTTQMLNERAKHCPICGLRQYPRLSPAVIMLVYRGEQLLLARAPRFRKGMYSVLAGFVEPGESLEEAVAREVQEEVGVTIKNIRYFGSQPWPFPNSLMVGFVAEYESGDLTPDLAEIEAADWFDRDNIPPVPGKLSIARKLIDWFISEGPQSRRGED